MRTLKEVGNAVLDILGPNGEHWTKHQWARTELGIACSVHNPKATCFCLQGAIDRLYLNTHHEKRQMVSLFINKLGEKLGHCTVPKFNDDVATSFADIKQLVESIQ